MCVSSQDGGLHGRPISNRFVRIDGFVQFFALKHGLKQRLYFRYAGRTADQHHIVDLILAHFGVLQRLLDRRQRGREDIRVDFLELGSGDVRIEIVSVSYRIDFYRSLRGCGKGSFRTLARRLQSSQCPFVAGQVRFEFSFVFFFEVLHHAVIDVFAAQVRVSSSRLDLEYPAGDLQDGHVERAAAEIEYQHVSVFVALLVEPISDRCRGGFVDDPLDVEPGDGAGIFRRLSLGVAEIRRHCYYRFGYVRS